MTYSELTITMTIRAKRTEISMYTEVLFAAIAYAIFNPAPFYSEHICQVASLISMKIHSFYCILMASLNCVRPK